jgi:hypothetical protein
MNAEIERLNARCDARGERIELLSARLAEAELTLRSIALSSCCGDCQEAKRVAQSYFGAAVSAEAVPHYCTHYKRPDGSCELCAAVTVSAVEGK